MAQPNSDAPVVEDDQKDVSNAIPPTLDQVHALNQNKLEEDEDNEPELDADGNPIAEEDDEYSGKSGDDAGDGEEETPVATPETPVEPEVPTPVETPADKPSTELDTDISKPAEGKVAIMGADGEKKYFNNLDEVPDDFEPASYKELMRGTRELMRKEDSDIAAAAQKVKDDEAADAKARADAMQVQWEEEASLLTTSGVFPNEPKKLEAAKEEVYTYIEDQLNKYNTTGGKEGAVLTSFAQAYKSMVYDKQVAKDAEDQKRIDDAKKQRSGLVQGGNGGTPSSGGSKGKVIQAPPSGAGLDAVHNNVISNL